MRVCLVTSYPPSRARLSEYAYELVKELDNIDGIKEITVLADKKHLPPQKISKKTLINHFWKTDDPSSILGLIFELLRIKPDIIHFNSHFFSMGNNKIANLAGLLLIPISRIFGFRVITTFHHIGIQHQDLKVLGISTTVLNRIGLLLGQRMVFKSNIVISHVKLEEEKKRNLVYIPHGTIIHESTTSDKNYPLNVIFFGVLAPYKGVEYLIEAFKKLENPSLRLIITGSSHPRFLDYIKKLKDMSESDGRILFTGYIPENSLSEFFLKGSIVALPYIATTGTSGVFHTAAGFGKATVMSDLPVFRQLKVEGASGLLFKPKDVDSLTKCLKTLFSNSEITRELGKKNFKFAKTRTWKIVAGRYWKIYSDLATLNRSHAEPSLHEERA